MNKAFPGPPSLLALAACGAALALGCTAELTGSGAAGGPNASAGASSSGGTGSGGTGTPGPISTDDDGRITNPPAFQPPAGMLRRLTRSQFRNAVRDIFGVEVDVTKLDADIGQFPAIGANAVTTSSRGVEQYHTAIEEAVDKVWTDSTKRTQFIGCTPGNAAADACTR